MKKLTCQEVFDQLADYLDNESGAELVAQVELHVGACHHCRAEVDTLRRTIMIYRCDERVVLPAPYDERLRAAMKQAYLAQDAADDPGLLDDLVDSGEGEA